MFPWSSITYLGDSALTVPFAAVLALWLLLDGKKGPALRWALVFCAGMALVVLTKLAFIGWNIGLPGLNFTGISGHSASAMSVLPVMVFLLVAGLPLPARIVLIGATFILIVFIGVSRVVLRVHSESEVIIGLMLGASMSLYFIACSGIGERVMGKRPTVLLAILLLAGSSAGHPAPTQDWLVRIALTLSGNQQSFTRTAPL